MNKYALISVYDKTGIIPFAKKLTELGYKIISTGGTAKVLAENSISYVPIQEITGNPESFDGRMKTISFQIESGILFDRQNKEHVLEAKNLNIKSIDIVVCNLYPFEKTVAKEGVKLDEAVENIDVGGPTMVRAAAKNFKNVLVVIDPKDYNRVINFVENLENPSTRSLAQAFSSEAQAQRNDIAEFRKFLAAKAFSHLSFYDSQIANFLTCHPERGEGSQSINNLSIKRDSSQTQNDNSIFLEEITLPGRKLLDLRYGENPHQQGALYLKPGLHSSLEHLERTWGRELSLINVSDINAGLESVRIFKQPAAAVIKHNSPSGLALGENAKESLQRAIEADPESAFGGIIVLNHEMTLDAAKIIGSFKDERRGNIDIVAVPSISQDALDFLMKVRKTMGIYTFGTMPQTLDPWNLKWVDNGFILQTADIDIEKSFTDWKVVTKKTPTQKQLFHMQVAWKFVSKIRSNSVLVVDKDLPMTRGIGSGQTSRVRSTKIALEQAGKFTIGGILASDSFFPFGDSVRAAGKAGILAIVQQGGSINDKDSIEAADELGIAMVFTGRRAFWH